MKGSASTSPCPRVDNRPSANDSLGMARRMEIRTRPHMALNQHTHKHHRMDNSPTHRRVGILANELQRPQFPTARGTYPYMWDTNGEGATHRPNSAPQSQHRMATSPGRKLDGISRKTPRQRRSAHATMTLPEATRAVRNSQRPPSSLARSDPGTVKPLDYTLRLLRQH